MKTRRFKAALVVTILALLAAGSAVSAGSDVPGETVVTLKTNQGDIVLRFFPDSAPEHVKNFIAHSESGYYTGTTFHRVIPGFVIQGGDPNSKDDNPENDGMGGGSYQGPEATLAAEFNKRPHRRGILSMARAEDPNSAGSQFFICQADTPFLDGKYTVFGEVIAGLDVVDRIVNVPRDGNDRPLENQTVLAVVVETWPTSKVEAQRLAMAAAESSVEGSSEGAAEAAVAGGKSGGKSESKGAAVLFWPPHRLFLKD